MTPSPSSRFTCRVVRAWSVVVGVGPTGAPSGLGSRHVETCEACQEYFGSCADFDAALRAEAALTRVTAPGLDNRIIEAIRETRESATRPRRRQVLFPALAISGALAAFALTFVLMSRLSPPGPTVAETAATPEEVLAAAQDLSSRFWGTVKPSAVSAAALAERNPLEQELNSVYSDARGAVDFLAANFLPGSRPSERSPSAAPDLLPRQRG